MSQKTFPYFNLILLSMFVTVFLTAVLPLSYGEETVNENELFSNPDSMVEQKSNVMKEWTEEAKNSVGFSGEVTSALINSVNRSTSTNGTIDSLIVGNLFLDARLKNQVKGFANVETIYNAQNKMTDFILRELFLDFSLKQQFYFRTGKQVLQWGRCYFWNPTDLINVERKTFIRKIGYREGAYGMKAHIPFGTKFNLYGFWDTGNTAAIEESAGALKAEFLIGNTEMAFSGWTRKNPVFGYDISTRFKTIDIAGEYSISRGDTIDHLQLKNGILSLYRRTDEWLSRASVSLGKYFRLGNFKDRISITSEWYYNESGYHENIFSDNTVYPYMQPVHQLLGTPITNGTKRDFLNQNNIYDMHNTAKYYTALFTTVNRFIITDMTLNVNYICNLLDHSGILSTGITYKNMHNFSAGFLVNSYVGGKYREYTYRNDLYSLQLTCGISF